MADWNAMLEELSTSKGSTSPVAAYLIIETIFEINHRATSALSLFTDNSLQLSYLRN